MFLWEWSFQMHRRWAISYIIPLFRAQARPKRSFATWHKKKKGRKKQEGEEEFFFIHSSGKAIEKISFGKHLKEEVLRDERMSKANAFQSLGAMTEKALLSVQNEKVEDK